jgi:hypothetical protein
MKGFLVVLLIVLFAFSASAQWSFVKVFPDTNLSWPSGINNGIAVDPAGKIWLQSYSGAVDSIVVGGVNLKNIGMIRVYNPNATEVSFSPIKFLVGASINDTVNGSGYGLAVDKDGNILSLKPSTTLYRINYKTGAAMTKKLNPVLAAAGNSMVTPAVDAAGEVFVSWVAPGYPAVVLNADFSSAGTTIKDTVLDFGRSIAVSADAKDVYLPRFTATCMLHYHSVNGSLGPYTFVDTLAKGLVIENSVWDKKGNLWVTSGNVTSGMPDSTKYKAYTEYAYNVTTKKVVDSITWHGDLSADPRPRGIAFSQTGDTAYIAVFNAGKSFVQMFSRPKTGVKTEPGVVVREYALSQNYPNPFNPSTEIKFSLSTAGYTTLRVYDVLGKEVSTLVNERLNSGAFSVTFDARNIPSGTYFYTLNVDGRQISKKMMLLK